MDPTRRGFVLITVSAVSFGGVAVLSKLALEAGMSVPTLQFWRWLIAAAVLAPVVLPRGLPRIGPRFALAGFALGAVLQYATSGVYVASLRYVSAGVGSFLLFTAPVFVAVLAAVLLDERLTRRGLVALGVAIAGLLLLAFGPDVRASTRGVALAVGSAALYAVLIVTGRRVIGERDPLPVAVMLMIGATSSFGVTSAWTDGWSPPPDAGTWLVVVVYGVVCTALPVATLYMALPRIGAPRTALVSTLEPVSTVVIAYFALQEVLSPLQGLGALLILGAVALLAAERRPADEVGPPAA